MKPEDVQFADLPEHYWIGCDEPFETPEAAWADFWERVRTFTTACDPEKHMWFFRQIPTLCDEQDFERACRVCMVYARVTVLEKPQAARIAGLTPTT